MSDEKRANSTRKSQLSMSHAVLLGIKMMLQFPVFLTSKESLCFLTIHPSIGFPQSITSQKSEVKYQFAHLIRALQHDYLEYINWHTTLHGHKFVDTKKRFRLINMKPN